MLSVTELSDLLRNWRIARGSREPKFWIPWPTWGPASCRRNNRDWGVAVDPIERPPEQLAELLASGNPSVKAAAEHGRVVIHLRGVLARDDQQIATAFNALGTRTPIAGTLQPAAADHTSPSPPQDAGGRQSAPPALPDETIHLDPLIRRNRDLRHYPQVRRMEWNPT